MSFVHDSIAGAGYLGLHFKGIGSGLLCWIVLILILFLAFLGIIQLIRTPFDIHRRKRARAEKEHQKQLEKERKAAEKAHKKGEIPPQPEHGHTHDGKDTHNQDPAS